MSTIVSIPTSNRYNALYGGSKLQAALIELAISAGYPELGMEKLAAESGGRVPSGSWLRKGIVRVPEARMEAVLDAGLQFTMDELKKCGLFNMPVMVAVDKHKVARYDH
ncbi:MAG: hypothetical protein JRN37_08730 [Nitrososphaerota archaeon]|jgi:hypothetical protein|nr:hypothetical protein [Nitrososphaerota archaeon]